MPNKDNPGDTAFIVENNRIIREVKTLNTSGGFVTIRFVDSHGGIKLRENRLFPSKEEAEANLSKMTMPRLFLSFQKPGKFIAHFG